MFEYDLAGLGRLEGFASMSYRRISPKRAAVQVGCVAIAGLGVSGIAKAATMQTTTADTAAEGPDGNPEDGNSIGGTAVASTTLVTARAGSNGTTQPIGRAYVIPFKLPTLSANQQFAFASLTLYYADTNGQGGTVGNYPDGVTANFDADLYGLGVRSTSTVLGSDYFQGTLDTTNATLIEDNILTPGTQPADGTPILTSALADTALVSYLNAQYAAEGAGSWVFLRINADADSGATGNFAYNFYTFDQGTVTYNGGSESVIPTISYTTVTVPEPATFGLATVMGSGFLCARRRIAVR